MPKSCAEFKPLDSKPYCIFDVEPGNVASIIERECAVIFKNHPFSQAPKKFLSYEKLKEHSFQKNLTIWFTIEDMGIGKEISLTVEVVATKISRDDPKFKTEVIESYIISRF